MRKILLLTLASLFMRTGLAQITLDNTYNGASQGLFMVELENSGLKYVVKSMAQGNRFLKFYHFNHALWKTIDCNAFPTTSYMGIPIYNFDALYISESLFACDTSIEFMYVSTNPSTWFTGIYKENGTALLTADSMAPLVQLNVPQQQRPIYNTPNGTKLILSHTNGSAKVYSLPCLLATGIDQHPASETGRTAAMSVYPNPSFYESHISYNLPEGVTQASIIISDMSGREIKRYAVDNTFNSLLIPQSDMAPGTYIYTLSSGGKPLDSKKIILATP